MNAVAKTRCRCRWNIKGDRFSSSISRSYEDGRSKKNESVPFRCHLLVPVPFYSYTWSRDSAALGANFYVLLLQNLDEVVESGFPDLRREGASMGDHHADAGDVDVEQLPYIVVAVQPVIDLDALAIDAVNRLSDLTPGALLKWPAFVTSNQGDLRRPSLAQSDHVMDSVGLWPAKAFAGFLTGICAAGPMNRGMAIPMQVSGMAGGYGCT